MNADKKLFRTISNSILKMSAVFLIAACIASSPAASFAATNLKASAEENSPQDQAFDKIFREGRDLIDRAEWAKAAEKFNEAVAKFPDNKSVDAALYWLALSYKKQQRFDDAAAALGRLLTKFPASSWVDDARVMRMEIGLPRGAFDNSGFNVSSPAYPAARALGGAATLSPSTQLYQAAQITEVYNSAAKTSLDREDEIKIAAFQSLLAADPKRAIEVAGEILTNDSKASETLKQEVLRVLRSPRLSRTENLTFASFGGAIDKQFAPLLRETLIKSFQKETNVKIRKEIIYALAMSSDDASINYLGQLYDSESDREIKKTIINSFRASTGGLMRQYVDADGHFIVANSNSTAKRKIAFDKLFEIVEREKDTELRRLAFTNLQRFINWAEDARIVDATIRLYEAETDEQFKILIIRSLAAAKQKQASGKLLSIAKNDKSDKLKLEAIYALRTSRDPEVLKFLEDLIK